MDTIWVVILVVVALVIGGAAAWYYLQQQRSQELQKRFGPEYERVQQHAGSKREAEKELQARQDRVDNLDIRPLSRAEYERFSEAWRTVQARFVDDPEGATRDADHLVDEVMEVRGYPVGDFDQRAADISVDHPRVVENYRAARDIAERNARGNADTEELRQAFRHYRTLFEDLLETNEASADYDGRTEEPQYDRASRLRP
jgi:hypothetical protein